MSTKSQRAARSAPAAGWDVSSVPVSLAPDDRVTEWPTPAWRPLSKAIQAKLAIGPLDDPLEREADRAAELATSACDPAGPCRKGSCTTCAPGKEARISLKAGSAAAFSGAAAPPIVHDVLRSPGIPLARAARSFFEPRFGYDFAKVRIHADSRAAESARAINALAYTVGHDVVLRDGDVDATTPAGKKLLAHELAHVVQQGASTDPHPLRVARRKGPGDAAPAAPVDAGTSAEKPAADQAAPAATDAGAPAPCPPKDQLDALEKKYKDIVKAGRDRGWNVAADNLQRFLDGTGGTRVLSVSWLRGFSEVTAAERKNQDRFETQLNDQANKMPAGSAKTFADHWERKLTGSGELYYASGTSQISSRGSFDLNRVGKDVSIQGTVQHQWADPYDWNPGAAAWVPGFGNVSDDDGITMQNCRGAKPFQMESDWQQALSAKISVGTIWNTKNFAWTGP